MEQSTIQWLGSPSCLRGSFAFYKSVSCRQGSGGPAQVWKLGEFYFMRCGPQEPVCIAEVTLLWEDQTQRHLLASSRLYFLPEDTPKGRAVEHGEDEVLAVSKKIVVRVEDLVKWTCQEPPQWKCSNQTTQGSHKSDVSQDATHPQEEKTESTDESIAVQHKVKVLSYPQYCRFRSLQRRVPDQANCPGLQDPHLLALGGIKLTLHNTRVLYCRDTFTHPTLDSSASMLTQFGCTSLSLKGRPRKRRGRDGKGFEQNQNHLSESWIERMKENVMGSVEMHWDGNWLPHPEEQLFLDQLYLFMERRGSPISKVPNLGFKKIDLFLMYSVVKKLGGYERVTSQRMWKAVYNELGGSPGSTSAATCTRRHYERLMLPYELHVRGENPELCKPRATSVSPITIKKAVPGIAVSNSPKNVVSDQVSDQASPPDGVVVRKRGRPPGKRNAKVLAKGRVGRPPLHAKPYSEKAERPHQEINPQSIFQELKLTNHPHAQGLSLVSSIPIPHQPVLGRDVKIETVEVPSFLSAPCKLLAGGSLEGFSPTKGLCPLDIFKARLGLNGMSSLEETPQDSSTPHQTIIVHQPKVTTPETPESHQHQCSGCSLDTPSQNSGLSFTRAPLPPLRILPLDIGCSLQLRQLMRTRLGSAHMNTFTKRLSEVLAQDLSKNSQPNGNSLAIPQEQSLPLNLSKRAITKRSAGDTELTDSQLQSRDVQSTTKRLKTEDLGVSLKWNGTSFLVPLTQDEPADLSSPSRARALLPDRTSGALTHPEATCFTLMPKLDVSTGKPSSIVASPDTLPCVYQLKQGEDKGSTIAVTIKKDPESTSLGPDLEPQPNSDLYSQPIPTDDLKGEADAVSSLKILSSSLLSKPSQSC